MERIWKRCRKVLNFGEFFLSVIFSFPLRNFPHHRPPRPIDDGAEILSVEGGWNKSVFLDKMVPRGWILSVIVSFPAITSSFLTSFAFFLTFSHLDGDGRRPATDVASTPLIDASETWLELINIYTQLYSIDWWLIDCPIDSCKNNLFYLPVAMACASSRPSIPMREYAAAIIRSPRSSTTSAVLAATSSISVQ